METFLLVKNFPSNTAVMHAAPAETRTFDMATALSRPAPTKSLRRIDGQVSVCHDDDGMLLQGRPDLLQNPATAVKLNNRITVPKASKTCDDETHNVRGREARFPRAGGRGSSQETPGASDGSK